MDCSTPGFPVHHQLLEPTQTHVHRVSDANHLILCRPLRLPPSIFPSIRVFSNESVFRIRWPKYWSFSFSISPSNEYSGLISFRIDWLDLLVVQCFKNGSVGKESACSARDGFDPWSGKFPVEGRKWKPTPLFLPGKSYGWRRLAGSSPQGQTWLSESERQRDTERELRK